MKKTTLIILTLFMINSNIIWSRKNNQHNIKQIYKYYRVKNFDKVKDLLELWLNKSPETFPTAGFLLLGNIYDHKKLFKIAIKIFSKGRTRAKNKFPFDLNIAQVLRHMKNHKQSIDMLEKMKQHGQFYPEIFLFLGMSYFQLKKRIQVINHWESYLNYKKPNKKTDKVRRALAWLKRKDFTWPDDLNKKTGEGSEDLKDFFKDLKESINKEKIKALQEKPSVKEGKLEIKDKGKEEGEKFDEIER